MRNQPFVHAVAVKFVTAREHFQHLKHMKSHTKLKNINAKDDIYSMGLPISLITSSMLIFHISFSWFP